MNVSVEWLRAFVPTSLTPGELRDLITSRVCTVDEVVPLREDLAPIVVARVVEEASHLGPSFALTCYPKKTDSRVNPFPPGKTLIAV